MNFFDFASAHPVALFFITLILFLFLEEVYDKTLRAMIVRKHGYPTDPDQDILGKPERE